MFLPPLLYSAAFFANLHELRARRARDLDGGDRAGAGDDGASSAVVAHKLDRGLPWAAAFVLGAIVSPTDPVAATAIARRLNVPRRVVSVIEGESLVNDGTALVAYRVAVGGRGRRSFSLRDAGLEFVLGAAGGDRWSAWPSGWLIAEIRRRLNDVPVEITISLLSGYAAYLPAERLGLLRRAGGRDGRHRRRLAARRGSPRASMRLQGYAVWETLVFLLNALLFVLIGLQLPLILDGLAGSRPRRSSARPWRSASR